MDDEIFQNAMADISLEMSTVAEGGNKVILMNSLLAGLCERVRSMGSLKRAADDMGLGYCRAWKLVVNAEGGLNFPLMERKASVGSTLTPKAIELLDAYAKIVKKSNRDFQKVCSLASEGE